MVDMVDFILHEINHITMGFLKHLFIRPIPVPFLLFSQTLLSLA